MKAVWEKWRARFFRLSVEGRLMCVFGLIFLLGLASGLPLNFPGPASFQFVERHYFRPLWIAFLLQLAIAVFCRSLRKEATRQDIVLLLKLQLFVIFTVFVHFNFKAWMPLVNPRFYDPLYHRLDLSVPTVLALLHVVRFFVAERLPFSLDFAYHHFFMLFFFFSFSLHILFDTANHLRQLVLAVCLVLLIGGICYWLAPAVGPFIFKEGVNEHSTLAQQHMLARFNHVLNTGALPPGYFAAPPAAMPSLHIAHTLVFIFFAWRHLKAVLPLYLPMGFWLLIESVCSAFHYLIDLPAGLLVGAGSIYLAVRLLSDPDEAYGLRPRGCVGSG